ncbi:MAG: single-stranded DNA-binding protein [Bacteroidota bacterium]
MNKVILTGWLAKDPDARTLPSGAMVVNLTVVTTEVFRDRNTGQLREATDYHHVVLWRGLAETASKYLHRGDPCFIEGKVRTHSYEKEGVKRYVTEVVADQMVMLGSRPDESGHSAHAENKNPVSGVNKVMLVGRLGKDPELRTMENGTTMINFSLASTEYYRDRDTKERKEITEWHHVVFWRALADSASKVLHKGTLVYVEGKLRTRSWVKDGITRYATEVIGESFTLLGSRREFGQGAVPQAEEQHPVSEQPPLTGSAENDLPF